MSNRLESHRHEFAEYLAVDGDVALDALGIDEKLAARLRAEKLDTAGAIDQFGDIASIEGISAEEAGEIGAAVEQWRTGEAVELWRVSVRVRALTDLDYSVYINTLREQVEGELDKAFPKIEPTADQRERGVERTEGISVVYTGLVPLVYKAQHELMAGLYSSLKWAFVLIAVVMVCVLRSPTAGLLSMVPNIFPVVMIFGAMGWLGIEVGVGTMMTASVALGVAVDDTIHFLTWFRRGLDQGRDRKGAVMLAYERCGAALTQTTIIGGVGLSVFAFSTFTPTQRFGVLMLALLTAALFGDLIFLPAVLSGPLGYFFRTSKKAKRAGALGENGDRSESVGGNQGIALGESENDVAAVPVGPKSGRKRRRDSRHRSTRAS